MKSRWFGAVLAFAVVASVACSWGAYDGVYSGPDGGIGQACNDQGDVVCSSGLICLNNVCTVTCTTDNDCATAQRCLQQSNPGGSCANSSCTVGTCFTASEGACDCPGETCTTCNANGVSESCALDRQCRQICNSGASTNSGCLAGQTCIQESCGGGGLPCTAHCYGAPPHDTPFDAGAN